MTHRQEILIGAAVLSAALVSLGVFWPSPARTADQNPSGVNVHPTADVHPTAYLEGKVTVGPFTRIDNTRIGKGAVLANGSATHVNQVIPENSFAEGVPAVVKKQDITDDDRRAYFGLLPAGWTRYEAANIEADIRKKKGL